MPKMLYFCWKIVKIAERWGLRLPDPLASGGWGLSPSPSPSQIFGYAPVIVCVCRS